MTVDYATANGTAGQPGDYTAASGSVSFAAGEVSKTVNVAVKGDALDEANEMITMQLSAPVNATIGDAIGAGTIRDDVPQSGVKITISDVISREGNGGLRTMEVTVSLFRAASTTVTVHYATSDSTAAQPSDYVARSGTLSFSAGVANKKVSVTTKGDTSTEATEKLRSPCRLPPAARSSRMPWGT